MTPDAEPRGRRTLTPGRAVLLGTLAVGVLDLLDAFVFFGARGCRRCASCTASRPGCWVGRRSGLPTALSAWAVRPEERTAAGAAALA